MLSARVMESSVVSSPSGSLEEKLDFDAVYRAHFDFVWRSVCRLGIPEDVAEDVAQEVFVVVHRRLESYEGRASVKGWLFGIVRGVVANARRSLRRRRDNSALAAEAETPRNDRHPQAEAEKAEAVRILYAILEQLDEDKRDVFVLAELEQLAVPEIAQVLEINVNTTYSRLRAGRRQFSEAAQRHRARERRRST
jgi:RNA polymerase sigma-70 factor (ECF subfamily)